MKIRNLSFKLQAMIREYLVNLESLTGEFSAKIRSSSGFSRSNLLTSVVCNTVHKFATALVKDRQEILHIRPAFVSLICNFLMFHHQSQYKNVTRMFHERFQGCLFFCTP